MKNIISYWVSLAVVEMILACATHRCHSCGKNGIWPRPQLADARRTSTQMRTITWLFLYTMARFDTFSPMHSGWTHSCTEHADQQQGQRPAWMEHLLTSSCSSLAPSVTNCSMSSGVNPAQTSSSHALSGSKWSSSSQSSSSG